MALFFYKAMDESGNIVEGIKEAVSEEEIIKFLEAKELLPIVIRKKDLKHRRRLTKIFKLFKKRISKKDVLFFTQSLSLLLKAGIPMDKALAICVETIDNEAMAKVIDDIREEIRQGVSLSGALSRYPNIFSRLYVNTVKAGEAGGILPEVLERIYNYMMKMEEFKSTLINSLIYPLFLVLVSLFSMAILIVFVVPRFYLVFSSAGVSPPFPIPQLAILGGFISKYGFLILVLSAIIILVFVLWFRKTERRYLITVKLFEVPFIGSLLSKLENIKFARNLGVLLLNGVPILQAILITKEMFINPIIKEELETMYRLVREGKRVSFVLERRRDIWHPMVIGMCGVGEESGTLGEMLVKASDVLERDVEIKLKRLVALIEPATILTMGLIVGSIVVSMISAIFSINEIVR